jgi:hypothetical protein
MVCTILNVPCLVRSLERFDKQLLDWLAKDPANNTSTTPGANKRKSKGGEGEESFDKSGDGTLTPTRGRKRILFSQSMIGNPLLNPESGQVLETTSEEDILSGTGLGEESFIISPVVFGSTSRADRESQEDGDETLVENTAESTQEKQDEVEVSIGADASKDDTEEFKSAESSLNTSDEADDTVGQVEETPKLTRKGRGPKETAAASDVLKVALVLPTASIDIEVLAASEEEEEEKEDDIFSDASSVASINLSKLPKGAILDNSSEDSQDDEIFAQSQSPPKRKPAPTKKGKSTKTQTSKGASSTRSTSSSPIPSCNLSTQSSRSSVVSSPTPRSSRSSRSSRTAATTSTPPTVKRKTTANKNVEDTPPTITKIKKTPVPKATLKTPTTAAKNSTSPVSKSRSGRNNSPRINYRTGASLVVETTSSKSSSRSSVDASPNLAKGAKKVQETSAAKSTTTTATTGRKRSKVIVSSSSSTSSPQPKKKAGEATSAVKGSKTGKKNLTDSSDDLVESTPPTRANR